MDKPNRLFMKMSGPTSREARYSQFWVKFCDSEPTTLPFFFFFLWSVHYCHTNTSSMAGTIQTLIFTPSSTKSLLFRYPNPRSPPKSTIPLNGSIDSRRCRSLISRPIIRACESSNQVLSPLNSIVLPTCLPLCLVAEKIQENNWNKYFSLIEYFCFLYRWMRNWMLIRKKIKGKTVVKYRVQERGWFGQDHYWILPQPIFFQ